MKGLPEDIDLVPLIGCELSQVCIGANQAILNFDPRVRLSIEGLCSLRSPNRLEMQIDSYIRDSGHLCALIGSKVTSARRQPDGGLVLELGNHELTVLNSERDYESFVLELNSRTYVA